MDDLFGNVEDLGDALLTPVSLRHMDGRNHGLVLTLVSSENWNIFAVRRFGSRVDGRRCFRKVIRFQSEG